MTRIAITFGTDHNEAHRAVIPEGTLSNGYVVIEAPSWAIARDIAFAIFGNKFAFDYDLDEFLSKPERAQWYSEGELLRVSWHAKPEPSASDVIRAIWGITKEDH